MGFSGSLGIFLHNFLSNREQSILANGVKSRCSKVKSGVPQGTVLGPILFLIMINDINQNVDSHISLFCDDTRVTKQVKTEDNVEDLQAELEKLYDWQEENNMLFNGSKFEMLRYGKDEILRKNTMYFTPDMEDVIEERDSLRDLGVIMNRSASFKDHVHLVTKKVNQKSGWILRTFKSRDQFFIKYMWKSLIQPHIDYCSQLYMPSSPGELEQIESLFRNFSRKIPDLRGMDYWTRLQKLKMYSMQRRMERYQIH